MLIDSKILKSALKEAGYSNDGEVLSIVRAIAKESDMVQIPQNSLGLLAICAIRYCHGRQTYMPSLIQKIVLDHIEDFSNKDLSILVQDCDFQESMSMFGDEIIDKPGWLAYKTILLEEYNRRHL